MDIKDWIKEPGSKKESDAKLFPIEPTMINTGAIARRYFPVIQTACNNQIEALKVLGDYASLNKATQIQLALGRLERLISLKEVISSPDIRTLIQENREEDIRRLHQADFSSLETLLQFRSVVWEWITEEEGSLFSTKKWLPNRFKVFCSIADALNSSGTECSEELGGIESSCWHVLENRTPMLKAVEQCIDGQLAEWRGLNSTTLLAVS